MEKPHPLKGLVRSTIIGAAFGVLLAGGFTMYILGRKPASWSYSVNGPEGKDGDTLILILVNLPRLAADILLGVDISDPSSFYTRKVFSILLNAAIVGLVFGIVGFLSGVIWIFVGGIKEVRQ